MSQSELVLKTYREITSRIEKPYYILEGLPANEGANQMLYSSPNLKDVIGLNQYELSSDPNVFFNSIHPDFQSSYLESNKNLIQGLDKDKRIYLFKNKETGEFVQVEELATSRLNKERNCFEIYCSLRSINKAIEVNDEADVEMVAKAFDRLKNLSLENRNKVFESTHHIVDTMAKYYKMNACRFYSYNDEKRELSILADNQNKTSKHLLESTTRLKTRSVVPSYSPESYFFKIFTENNYQILEERNDILEVLKAHTESTIVKKLAGTALRVYKLKSFGFIPICCSNGRIVGLVTFGSSQIYSPEKKKEIFDFASTTSFPFTCLLSQICEEA